MASHSVDGNGRVSWELLVIVSSFAAGVAWFAIDLGGIKQQVKINTERLSKIEAHDIQTRELEAKIDARLSVIESQIIQHMRETPAR